MGDELRRRADEILHYYGELDRRVAGTGMDGIVGLLTVSQHVVTALQEVQPKEIDSAVRELRALVERLVRIDSELQRVRTLKTRVASDDDVPASER